MKQFGGAFTPSSSRPSRRWRGTIVTVSISARKAISDAVTPRGRGKAIEGVNRKADAISINHEGRDLIVFLRMIQVVLVVTLTSTVCFAFLCFPVFYSYLIVAYFLFKCAIDYY